MTKVVINVCYGGFGLSVDAVKLYAKLSGQNIIYTKTTSSFDNYELNGEYWGYYDIPRDDPFLVQVVEQLGSAANGFYSELKVVEIPDDVEWYIDEYDGHEHVAEKHSTWY